MLTISKLAAYAGVTVKAVRHYHSIGLLPEAERDHSGYRRYDARTVVELIKIRTLADAGVPLARVQTLLRADATEFEAAVEEIDRRLEDEIRQRQRHRERIRRLASGDSLALPPEAVAYLDRLRALGLPDRVREIEADAWILVAAELPDQMPDLMAIKNVQLDQPAVIRIYCEMTEALDWRSDDPRLQDIADDLVRLFEAGEEPRGAQASWSISDDLAALLDSAFLSAAPYAHRLLALLEDRGWSGWTKVRRVGLRSRPTALQATAT